MIKRKEYLLNFGFFYAIVIPEENSCYILKGKEFEHSDVQNFINNEEIDYSQYEKTALFYKEDESWTSYLESDNPVTYTTKKDLDEATYKSFFVDKKNTDGLLLAEKNPAKNKVKVYKKNAILFHP